MRLRLAFAFGAALLVMLAFVVGVSLIAALFTRTSESSAYVGGGVLGRAVPAGLVPAIVVGAAVGYLCQPFAGDSHDG